MLNISNLKKVFKKLIKLKILNLINLFIQNPTNQILTIT